MGIGVEIMYGGDGDDLLYVEPMATSNMLDEKVSLAGEELGSAPMGKSNTLEWVRRKLKRIWEIFGDFLREF